MEQRLIDANELLGKSFNTGYEYGEINVVGTTHIENAPTIDPVHAAGGCYCRECKYKKITNGAYKTKGYLCASKSSPCRNRIVSPVDFCSHGERKQNEILD